MISRGIVIFLEFTNPQPVCLEQDGAKKRREILYDVPQLLQSGNESVLKKRASNTLKDIALLNQLP